MRAFIRSTPLLVGFLGGLLLFVAANLLSYSSVPSGDCMDCLEEFGWPLPLGARGGFVTVTVIRRGGLAADLLIALASSLLAGSALDLLLKARSGKFR